MLTMTYRTLATNFWKPAAGSSRRSGAFAARSPRVALLLAGAAALTACSGGNAGEPEAGSPTNMAQDPLQPGGSPAEDDELAGCGIDYASAQPLPVTVGGDDVQYVMSVVVAGGDVFYSSYFQVYRVQLGDTTGASWEVLATESNRYFVSDTQLGLLGSGSSSLELSLEPLGGGSAQTQPLLSASAVWQSQYDASSNSLYGETSFYPFSYFRHDLATGQEEEFRTTLQGGGSDDWSLAADDMIVLTAGSNELVPSKLYRLPKGGTEALPIETGIGVKFRLLGRDSSNLYLNALGEAAGFERTIYRLPLAGGSAQPISPDPGIFWILHVTGAGTFLEKLESASFTSKHALYRIGPSAADAAAPRQILSFSIDCDWEASFATDQDLYVVVQPVRQHYLLRLPLSRLL
jgi:hypothetical protein